MSSIRDLYRKTLKPKPSSAPAKAPAQAPAKYPYYTATTAHAKACMVTCTCGAGHVCTQLKGHQTPEHEAHESATVACCPPWLNEDYVPQPVKGSEWKDYGLALGWKLKSVYTKVDTVVSGCNKSPLSTPDYVCTRAPSHDGPHEAHFSGGRPCGPPWTDD